MATTKKKKKTLLTDPLSGATPAVVPDLSMTGQKAQTASQELPNPGQGVVTATPKTTSVQTVNTQGTTTDDTLMQAIPQGTATTGQGAAGTMEADAGAGATGQAAGGENPYINYTDQGLSDVVMSTDIIPTDTGFAGGDQTLPNLQLNQSAITIMVPERDWTYGSGNGRLTGNDVAQDLGSLWQAPSGMSQQDAAAWETSNKIIRDEISYRIDEIRNGLADGAEGQAKAWRLINDIKGLIRDEHRKQVAIYLRNNQAINGATGQNQTIGPLDENGNVIQNAERSTTTNPKDTTTGTGRDTSIENKTDLGAAREGTVRTTDANNKYQIAKDQNTGTGGGTDTGDGTDTGGGTDTGDGTDTGGGTSSAWDDLMNSLTDVSGSFVDPSQYNENNDTIQQTLDNIMAMDPELSAEEQSAIRDNVSRGVRSALSSLSARGLGRGSEAASVIVQGEIMANLEIARKQGELRQQTIDNALTAAGIGVSARAERNQTLLNEAQLIAGIYDNFRHAGLDQEQIDTIWNAQRIQEAKNANDFLLGMDELTLREKLGVGAQVLQQWVAGQQIDLEIASQQIQVWAAQMGFDVNLAEIRAGLESAQAANDGSYAQMISNMGLGVLQWAFGL